MKANKVLWAAFLFIAVGVAGGCGTRQTHDEGGTFAAALEQMPANSVQVPSPVEPGPLPASEAAEESPKEPGQGDDSGIAAEAQAKPDNQKTEPTDPTQAAPAENAASPGAAAPPVPAAGEGSPETAGPPAAPAENAASPATPGPSATPAEKAASPETAAPPASTAEAAPTTTAAPPASAADGASLAAPADASTAPPGNEQDAAAAALPQEAAKPDSASAENNPAQAAGHPVIKWSEFFDDDKQITPSNKFWDLSEQQKTVEIKGFMGEVLSFEKHWFLLIPEPGAECPFDNGDETYWNKIMIVFVPNETKLRYTSGPLKVTGRLDVGIKVDESGYKTMFRLYDASFEKIKE